MDLVALRRGADLLEFHQTTAHHARRPRGMEEKVSESTRTMLLAARRR